MIFSEKKYILGEKEIVLRSARTDEAQMLIDYLKAVTGETRFLMCEPDEVGFTKAEEENLSRNTMTLTVLCCYWLLSMENMWETVLSKEKQGAGEWHIVRG